MILGRFYFKQTQNGNLLGEFSNQTSLQNHTESADFLNASIERDNISKTSFQLNPNSALFGNYHTTWFEEEAISNHLRIFPKPNTNNQILLLEWTNGDSDFVFRGEGFIVDGILIGNYWDRPVNRRLNNIFIAPFNDSRP